MKYEPLFARVLLAREKMKSKAGIIIPDNVAQSHASHKCKVVAVGPTADESIKVGDTVVVGKFAGAWIDDEGNPSDYDNGSYFICTDEDLLVKVVDES